MATNSGDRVGTGQGGLHIEQTKYCVGCGVPLHKSAPQCPKCGAAQGSGGAVYSGVDSAGSKNRIVAAIFALLLGGLGIHKFYLGQVGSGILYLLFCWTGIPAIVGFIEGILLLVMDERKFHSRFG